MLGRVAALVVALVFVPIAVANSPPPSMGTESNPELSDPPNNVAYGAAYVGPQNRDHVDVLAAWLEYSPHNDTTMAVLKFNGLERLLTDGRDWTAEYGLSANITLDEETTASVGFRVVKRAHTDAIETYATIGRGFAGEMNARLPHSSAVERTNPGYFRFWVSTESLRQHGNALQGLNLFAGETQSAAGVLIFPIYNTNEANSDAMFSFEGLRPTNGTTDDDALPALSRSTTPSTDDSEKTAGFLVVATTLVVAGVAVRRHRRQ